MARTLAARPPPGRILASPGFSWLGFQRDAATAQAFVRQVFRLSLLTIAARISLHLAFCPPSALHHLLHSCTPSGSQHYSSGNRAAAVIVRHAVVSDAAVNLRGLPIDEDEEEVADDEVMAEAEEVVRDKRGRHAWHCWLDSNGVSNARYRPNRYENDPGFLRDFLKAWELDAFAEEYSDFQYLVDRVNKMQAKDPRASQAWEFWAGRVDGGNEVNPEWHSPTSLRDFLSAFESKALMKEAKKVYELTEKIVALQEKGGPAIKEQWKMYCQRFKSDRGSKDRMCSGLLEGFLKHYEDGYQLTSVASTLRRCMIFSPDLWRAWRAYVSNHYGEAFDSSLPYKFHESHVLNFLNHLVVDQSKTVEGFTSNPVALRSAQYHKSLVKKVSALLQDERMKEAWMQFVGDGLPSRMDLSFDPHAQSDRRLEAFLRQEAPDMLGSRKNAQGSVQK